MKLGIILVGLYSQLSHTLHASTLTWEPSTNCLNLWYSSSRNPPTYITFFYRIVAKVKPNINIVGDHPQGSHEKPPLDGALVAVDSVWPISVI